MSSFCIRLTQWQIQGKKRGGGGGGGGCHCTAMVMVATCFVCSVSAKLHNMSNMIIMISSPQVSIIAIVTYKFLR